MILAGATAPTAAAERATTDLVALALPQLAVPPKLAEGPGPGAVTPPTDAEAQSATDDSTDTGSDSEFTQDVDAELTPPGGEAEEGFHFAAQHGPVYDRSLLLSCRPQARPLSEQMPPFPSDSEFGEGAGVFDGGSRHPGEAGKLPGGPAAGHCGRHGALGRGFAGDELRAVTPWAAAAARFACAAHAAAAAGPLLAERRSVLPP
jgi:hypothetical protein